MMNINRSGFYKWLKRRSNPSIREINRNEACDVFLNYHNQFPSHGYRWLNCTSQEKVDNLCKKEGD